MFLFILLLTFVNPIQCYRWRIPTAMINTQTVIACGLSIDIYSSFDPAQVIICPYIWIEKEKIQLISLNISFDDRNHQLIISSNPPWISPPKTLIKFSNHSLLPPLNLTRTSIYYLSFSSELICRYSPMNNQTICFYYPISSNFRQIEYHYDEIQHGSLVLSKKSRTRFHILFLVISIFVLIICFFAISLICTEATKFHHLERLDVIIDTQMARQEAARRPAPEQPQEGHAHAADAHQVVLDM